MKRVIVDVREPYEYKENHVAGAINIPPSDLLSGAKALGEIPKDSEIILYCKSGARSNMSINILRDLGYTNLINGINADQVRRKYL